ncbi:DNA recombination protein RmuC [Pantoea sp. Mhis]|uniref:DNA recombination protein RmuC n=1 Tax=Pantoea sp. Mhis TaxID=2576759 RepID=UPI0013599A9A|nr:DNA recombination protein RmuC [Pantoea sp. Mhis]MXP56423.1 DNA recombination protein RmuC [Pantoea sp. Mhis]
MKNIVQQFIIKYLLILISFIIGWIFSRLYCIRYYSQFMIKQRLLRESYEEQKKQIKNMQYQLQKRKQEIYKLHNIINNIKTQLHQIDYWRKKNKNLSDELQHQLEINHRQEDELRTVNLHLGETRLIAEEQQRFIVNSEQRLNIQFENLANLIFENNSRRLDEQNQKNLNQLITPLNEDLKNLRHELNNNFNRESHVRYTLVNEINQLKQINIQMAEEAINFTKALKGHNKVQGNWGEVVLNKVLESSGLREGYEYETQVSVSIEQNCRMQPDVIVHLPQGRDVVIDAKMTLIAYERYFNAEDNSIRDKAIQEHIDSIRNHIRSLGKKDYQQLPGFRTLDYVLMFIPIEPAFLLAIDRQPELISEALKLNIMLVSPTTLLVALRTIDNLWRCDNQNRNAQRIANRAARLYDKIRLFIDDMNSIGLHLDKLQQNYQLAMKKLVEGKGNLIAQSEYFRKLGVDIKRPIDQKLVFQANLEDSAENENINT